MKSVVNFFSEVRMELGKVTWPSREKTIKLTLIVFSVSAIIGFFVGTLDYGFTRLLSLILVR